VTGQRTLAATAVDWFFRVVDAAKVVDQHWLTGWHLCTVTRPHSFTPRTRRPQAFGEMRHRRRGDNQGPMMASTGHPFVDAVVAMPRAVYGKRSAAR